MGIEPLLCALIPVIGLVLQAVLALYAGILRRRRRGLALCARLAHEARAHGFIESEPGRWVGVHAGRPVELDLRRLRTDLQRRRIEAWAGEPVPGGRFTPIGQPSVLLSMAVRTPLKHLRIAHPDAGVPGEPIGDPILDLAMRCRCDDPTALRTWLQAPGHREQVLGLLGDHHLGLILDDRLVIWTHDRAPALGAMLRDLDALSRSLDQNTFLRRSSCSASVLQSMHRVATGRASNRL